MSKNITPLPNPFSFMQRYLRQEIWYENIFCNEYTSTYCLLFHSDRIIDFWNGVEFCKIIISEFIWQKLKVLLKAKRNADKAKAMIPACHYMILDISIVMHAILLIDSTEMFSSFKYCAISRITKWRKLIPNLKMQLKISKENLFMG